MGQKIKAIREAKGISQQELAERLGYINQSQISKIEKGHRKVTAVDLIAIAKALEVTIEAIVAGAKQKVI